jgi:hypothetical protein
MAKQIVNNYYINLEENAIYLQGNIHSRNLLIMTDVDTSTIIFNFANPALGYQSVLFIESLEYTKIVLTLNLTTAGVLEDAAIQIFVEKDDISMDVNESLLDPVNKIRVSTPENLIDTDFEYGLQSAKWETLELSNNIPSFYSTNSDTGLSTIQEVLSLSGSDVITVVCFEPHRLVIGTPIDVRGLTSQTAEGKYLISNVNTEFIFSYKARGIQSITGVIDGPYTTITPGQFYSGSQIGFNSMLTDGASESTITVNLGYEHGFRVGSSFYLVNSVSPKFVEMLDTTGTAPDGRPRVDFQNTLTSTFQTDSSLNETKRYRSGYYRKLLATNIDVTNSRILWQGHALRDGDCLLYIPSAGDTEIGGLQRFQMYYVRDAVAGASFRLTPNYQGSAVTFTSAGTYNFGRHALHLAYEIGYVNNTSWDTNFYTARGWFGVGSGWDRYESQYYSNNLGWTGLMGATRPRLHVLMRRDGQSFNSRLVTNWYGTSKNSQMVFGEGSTSPGPYNFIEDAERYFFSTGFDESNSQHYFFNQPYIYAYGINGWSEFNTGLSESFNRGSLFYMPLFEDEEADSFYAANSALIDNTTITLNIASGAAIQSSFTSRGNLFGTQTIGTVSAGSYRVERVSTDRFRIKDTNGNPIFIYSAQGVYQWTGQQDNQFANSFYIANHGLSNNDLVKIQTTGGGTLPSTSTGAIIFNSSTQMQTVFNLLSSALDTHISDNSYIVPTILDGFSRSYPMQYASPNGSSDGAIQYWQSNGANIYDYALNQGLNSVLNDGQTDWDTETPQNLVQGNSGYKVIATNYVQNRSVPYYMIITAPPPNRQAEVSLYWGSFTFSGWNYSQYNTTNYSGQWYYTGMWTHYSGAANGRRGAIEVELRVWNEDWNGTNTNNFYAYNGGSFRYIYGGGWDFFTVLVFMSTNTTTSLSQTQCDALRDRIMSSLVANFVFPTLSNGTTALVTLINNNRFKIKTPAQFEYDITSSGTPVIQFELINLSFGSADGAYQVTNVPSDTTLQFKLPFKAAIKEFQFDSATAIDGATDLITLPNHNLAPATPVAYDSNGNASLTNLTNGSNYFAYVKDPDTIGLANSANDATFGLLIDLSSGSGTHRLLSSTVNGLVAAKGTVTTVSGSRTVQGSDETLFKRYFKIGDNIAIVDKTETPGSISNFRITAIADDTKLIVSSPIPFSASGTDYLITSFLYVRPDGTFQHRPFDGGVEITAGTAPDSQIVRQTRKYFRYQSGKGIQISLAINFNPPRLYQSLTGVLDTDKIAKCQRDIGYVLDGVQYDVALGTNYNAIFYGIAETNSLDISQLVIDSIENSKTQVLSIGAVAGDTTALDRTNEYYTELLNIVQNGRSVASSHTYPNPTNATASQIACKDKLIANLANGFITTEINAYVQANFAPTDHDEAKCTRDIKYAVYGFIYDILYGGNQATYNGARFFLYGFASGANGIISSHITQTVAAYDRLNTIVSQIVQGQSVTRSAGNTIVQDTSGANGSSGDAAILQGFAQNIADVIETGTLDLLPAKVNPSITWATAGIQAASNAIGSTKASIVGQSVPNITTGRGTTKYPHGLFVGQRIRVQDSVDPAYNGTFPVTTIPDPFTFTYTLTQEPSTSVPAGLITYNVESWTNSRLRAGMFDFQNGFFFEFDGSTLFCCRRSSTAQISGEVNVQFNSNIVTGVNTNFVGQLEEGELIVIRGMSYKVIKIKSRTELVIQPQYKGISTTGIIVTKTIDTKIPQNQWNLDVCDGSGFTGFVLDTTKIQMSYMDYSWYGAGKIRFGFKTRTGRVQYVHDFVHNNRLTEAYMRSGNLPARYEIENTGTATYIPSLFHWGTSVIMDGRFDDDKAYLFTANSRTLTFTNGQASTATTTGNSQLVFVYNRSTRTYDWFVNLFFSFSDAAKFTVGTPLYTENLALNGNLVNSAFYTQSNFVVRIFITSSLFTPPASSYPSVNSGTLVGIGSPITGGVDGSALLRGIIPLVSIRLAPSVDNSLTGNVGEREIINRMQLQLSEVGLVLTHDAEVQIILNSNLSNDRFTKVQAPSLSNLITHEAGDTVIGGTTIFQFRASGGSVNPDGRRLSNTSDFDLTDITDLGNSVLGGDGVFPNGPDLLTVAIKVINVAEVSASSPFTCSSRITWSESQA